jgi:transcriptional regulator with XRE-family HTH domain
MDLRELAQRIRTRREKAHLKQNDLASALQVSPQAVSKWERGENAPDIVQLVPLARLLGVSADWLLGGFAEDRDVFEATVLASGAIGAREMSEALAPKDFATWTSGVCFPVTEAVLRNDGVPVKYNGPGILCFFSGADHRRRAMLSAIAARTTSAVPLKIGLSTGMVYFGAVGHPDYAQSDIMGQAVSIALLGCDWAAEHTTSGIAACCSTAEGQADRRSIGPAQEVMFPGIGHAVAIHEIECPGGRP